MPTIGNAGREAELVFTAAVGAARPRRREGDLGRRLLDVGLSFREGRSASAVAYRESVRDAAEGVRRA
jgi:hypothetical protein